MRSALKFGLIGLFSCQPSSQASADDVASGASLLVGERVEAFSGFGADSDAVHLSGAGCHRSESITVNHIVSQRDTIENMTTSEYETTPEQFAANHPEIFGAYSSVVFDWDGFNVWQAIGSDNQSEGDDAIIGAVVFEPGRGFYLACQTCKCEIGVYAAGMCGDCRNDLAYRDGNWALALETDENPSNVDEYGDAR